MNNKNECVQFDKTMINEISSRIARMFTPEKIILFGSHATGRADSHSDIDLLVITNFTGGRRKLMVKMDQAIALFKKPVDIVIQTTDEYAQNSKIPGTISRYALLEGKVLYERHT